MSTTDSTQADAPQPTEPDLETWDPEQWLAGSTATTRSVRVYAAAGLLAEAERLERQRDIARQIPDEGRGLNDRGPDALQQQIDELYGRFQASGRDVVLEGRSNAARRKVRDALPEDVRDDKEEQALHWIADAVQKPQGITAEWLRQFREQHQSQYVLLHDAYWSASLDAPTVTLPFSGGGSAPRGPGRRASR